jgi:ferritin-like metal-binding protein YciE
VFVHELQDIYGAEKQILKALPTMIKAAGSNELSTALQDHMAETERQVSRLEEAFAELDVTPKSIRCEGMEGILKEGKELTENGIDGPMLDAALIGAAQRVEHYETAAYGTLVAWARSLGYDRVASLLSETLTEEEEADARLTELAESGINSQAASARQSASR